jgi:hypothetical protein
MNKWNHTSTPIYAFLAGTETTSSLPQKLTINLPDLRSIPARGSCRIFQNDTESAETNSGTQKLTNKNLTGLLYYDLFGDLKLLVSVI